MESIISFQRLAFLVKPGTPKGDPLMGEDQDRFLRGVYLPFQGRQPQTKVTSTEG